MKAKSKMLFAKEALVIGCIIFNACYFVYWIYQGCT
jgi:hypothetical protein